MDSMVVMLMEKERDSGFLAREVGSYTIKRYGELIDRLFSIKVNEKEIVYLRLTVEKDVEDWEYTAIYEEYDASGLEEHILSFDEVEDTFNPIWEITFDFSENQEAMEEKLQTILDLHKRELDRVYVEIPDRKSLYQ